MSKEQIIDEAYENYCNKQLEYWKDENGEIWHRYSKEEFIDKCKTDNEFSEKWGLKIKERELSLEERSELGYKYVEYNKWDALLGGGKESDEELCDDYNIPTKLITITYNDKTIESYESGR